MFLLVFRTILSVMKRMGNGHPNNSGVNKDKEKEPLLISDITLAIPHVGCSLEFSKFNCIGCFSF